VCRNLFLCLPAVSFVSIIVPSHFSCRPPGRTHFRVLGPPSCFSPSVASPYSHKPVSFFLHAPGRVPFFFVLPPDSLCSTLFFLLADSPVNLFGGADSCAWFLSPWGVRVVFSCCLCRWLFWGSFCCRAEPFLSCGAPVFTGFRFSRRSSSTVSFSVFWFPSRPL